MGKKLKNFEIKVLASVPFGVERVILAAINTGTDFRLIWIEPSNLKGSDSLRRRLLNYGNFTLENNDEHSFQVLRERILKDAERCQISYECDWI